MKNVSVCKNIVVGLAFMMSVPACGVDQSLWNRATQIVKLSGTGAVAFGTGAFAIISSKCFIKTAKEVLSEQRHPENLVIEAFQCSFAVLAASLVSYLAGQSFVKQIKNF